MKQQHKGVFWWVEGKFVAVKVPCDLSGVALVPCEYSSKSDENFNHRAEWKKLPCSVTLGHPFDYYPRGRVEVKNGKTEIWLHPSLCEQWFLSTLVAEFGLDLAVCRVRPDHSRHYQARETERKEKESP